MTLATGAPGGWQTSPPTSCRTAPSPTSSPTPAPTPRCGRTATARPAGVTPPCTPPGRSTGRPAAPTSSPPSSTPCAVGSTSPHAPPRRAATHHGSNGTPNRSRTRPTCGTADGTSGSGSSPARTWTRSSPTSSSPTTVRSPPPPLPLGRPAVAQLGSSSSCPAGLHGESLDPCPRKAGDRRQLCAAGPARARMSSRTVSGWVRRSPNSSRIWVMR